MTTTRTQVLDHIEAAFGHGPVTSDEMREAALASGADQDVLFLLDALPDRQFTSPREIWPHLPDLPVGG
ncbi:hypothetical protein IN07_18645 [Modestobacter caceresii]|uniref:DUF2795 domain-containing protein n=1 Tax=Modestobacter caceresii TaxID=1522368 RepID=A0A098Y465_9ACTN|nr:DUF2795 domain-containing protein [Modestobacter caceresii]KGH45215.1 hypothetical protein IN07_18645 [Modestobacter caceresii]